MTTRLNTPRWMEALRRWWLMYHLGLPEFRFMFEPPPPGEWVALDCETTGLNVRTDEIISVGAVRIVGNRPLVGYYLEFDLAMLNRAIWPLLGQGLPQPAIEVSALYYDYKFRQLPPYQQQANPHIDLRFATLMADLGLPTRHAHDALNDAVMAALAFIKLRQLRGE